ncbi:ARM repeat-containing protein [Rhodocollybia butyracea]|uniref:ARM repeat-containing protein n=1 Tax=Rhodocollybia butyracea TaxID=206335 RepID=A0A9P5UFB7_9AGAR|nr:ARM repeat-containing protein [Rhodocollybia butyracea]
MSNPSNVAECLAGTLDANPNIRMAAELKLTELMAAPETGLALSQIIVAQDADINLRQISFFSRLFHKRRVLMTLSQHSASIILRKFVRERWSPYFQSFKGSAPSPEIKTQIRQAVFHGLSDPARKIRSLSAHTLSSIANCDWPDEYPDLLTSLINLLSSNSPESVHGAMQVFTEFIKSDLTEDQILPVLRDLLPVLLSILGSTESQTPLTRSRTVSVFRQCVISLFMVKEQHPQAVKEAIASVLPVWLEAFKVLLNMDPQKDVSDNWEGLAVRIQIFKALDTIHTSFPRSITPYLHDLLPASLIHLNSLYSTFECYYLASSETVPSSSEDEAIELPQLITSVMDFVSSVARNGRAKDWFAGDNSIALVSAVFNYIQMTDDDEETWANNANAFVAQEDDDLAPYSVRVAGLDLLTCLLDRSPAQTTTTCDNVIQKVVVSSDRARSAGKKDWWRPLEAALTAVGSQAETIQECIDDERESGRNKPIDIESLLTNVIPTILGQSEFPFLQGRGFVFASQYAKLLPVQLAGQYLDAAIHVIEANDASIPIKVSAVKAVHNFCVGSDDKALAPFIPRIAKDLGPFLAVTSEDTLSLVLETLSVVLDVDKGKWLTQELADPLVIATLDVWTKNNKDPIFLSIFPDIINSLAGSQAPGIYETVVKQALPPLCNAIAQATASSDQAYIAGSAIELVSSLVKASTNGLGDGFFALLAPSLFKCLSEVEDRDVLQNGISCLTLVVRKDCSQLLGWRDNGSGSGQSGLEHVLRLVARILQAEDESAGLTIGELIIHLLRRAGESVLPVLPDLLCAMVTRMLSAKTATFVQSLVIPFAFLINNQTDTVLSLLEEMNIQGRTGLDVLIQTWCENAETFQGYWPSRTSTMALTALFTSARPSLQNLMVKGDIVLRPETKNVIMTRSRTKTTPTEFTSVSFPVKAIKILLHEVQSGGEPATMGNTQEFADDIDSEDGDDDWADSGDVTKESEFEFLSQFIGPKGMAFDNDDILDDSDDEDLKEDPISRIDIQQHLITFFRESASRNTNQFSNVVDQLSAEEMLVVHKIVDEHRSAIYS